MATLKIPRKEIEKHIKLTPEIIKNISMMGIPLESATDEEIEIEVLANRPDILSAQGFIRTLKAYFGKEQGLKKYKVRPPEKDYRVKIDPSLKDIRPFTACAIVKGLKFDDAAIKEIVEIQEKMHTTFGRNRKKIAIGIYPLERIKLPIKFEARKPEDIRFIPLESDKEMNGLQILQQHPKGRDYAHLLEGLNKFPVFVDSARKILSMPPIINSHETGKITEKTSDIFIECSGSDYNALKKALNILVTTLADLGGTIYQMELEYDKKDITPNLEPEKMKISLENTNKLLGLSLTEKDLEKLLPKMGYDYKKGFVYVPAWRTDVLHEVDIIEDIAIAYGYDKLIPEIPKVATIGEESKESKTARKIAEILTGLGMLETSSYYLIKEEEANNVKLADKIELIDSKTEYKILRPNLTIPALRVFSENKDNEYPQKIFEIGTVFSRDKSGQSDTGIKEEDNLVIACSPANFTELKQILDYLTRMLGISYSLSESSHPMLIEGRTAEVRINNKPVGYLGEMHPESLRLWNLKMPVALLEISLSQIQEFL